MRLFRWRAIIPFVLLLALLVVLWILLLDRTVRRAIEEAGTEAIGAKVDVAQADVQLGNGALVLRGLEVTNPNSPMTNLFEAREIVANLNVRALLEKKVVVETLAVRDVRFGTPRETSGAVPRRSPATGAVFRQVDAFVQSIPIPELSLEGLAGQVVNLEGISVDSLRTPAQAMRIVTTGDSLRRGWQAEATTLDPRPLVDSATALVERVRAADPIRLGPTGIASLVASSRAMLERLDRTKSGLAALEQSVRTGADTLRARVLAIDDARRADYAYARGLVRVPSLAEPELTPALFGAAALERLKPILYWLGIAERYLPPGLDPRRRAGPSRPRLAGSTARYPRRGGYPAFLLQYGEASLSIGGSSAATGAYAARLAGLTTEPSLYGRPFQFVAERTGAAVGPTRLRVAGALDHTTPAIRDSVSAVAGGFPLPQITVGGVNARVDLGQGTTELSASRRAEAIAVRWAVRAPDVTWARTDPAPRLEPARIGSKAWAEDFLWRSIAGVQDVRIEAWLSGTLDRPTFGVRSNVGEVLAASLRRELGAEIARAEALVRAEVDRLVGDAITQARGRVDALETDLLGGIVTDHAAVAAVETALATELQKVTRLPGIRIP